MIGTGKILLGVETLHCPLCGWPNKIEIHSDLPAKDWLTCKKCGYRALLDYGPILKKYGLPQGLSRAERRTFGQHLKRDIAKI
jgi:hypothetical protein